jgi:predicted RNA-binding Zn ribbon-like protein
VQAEDGVKIVQREHMLDAEELLALIAAQIALLISHEDSQLVRRCAGASCTLRFLDRTKAHRRVFCSAAACGNRAKVAAFRNRQRG